MNRSSYHGKLAPSASGDESTAEISLSSINTDVHAESLFDRLQTSLDMDTHNPMNMPSTTSHSTRARRHLEAIIAEDGEGDHEEEHDEEEDDDDLLQESFAIDDTATSSYFGSLAQASASMLTLDKYVSDVDEEEEDEDLVPPASPSTSSVPHTEG